MGTDFFYSGKLPHPPLQELVIRFVESYFTTFTRVQTKPENGYRTLWENLNKKTLHESYPFDYFGIIPYSGFLFSRSQFVFDRSAQGELVTLLDFPAQHGMPPIDEKERYFPGDEWRDVAVCVESGGYCRLGGGGDFALLLNILQLRYWPDLSVSDDYQVTIEIGEMIKEYGLLSAMKNWRLDFPACSNLFEKEHLLRNPKHEPPPIPERNLKLVQPDVMNILLDTLDMSVRSAHCLRNEGIETVGELMKYTPSELKKMKNVGTRCIRELQELLWDLGVQLRPE